MLDLPLNLPAKGEFGAALGAARLAILATTGAPPEEVITIRDWRETVEPVKGMHAMFEDAYGRYRAAYPALKSVQ